MCGQFVGATRFQATQLYRDEMCVVPLAHLGRAHWAMAMHHDQVANGCEHVSADRGVRRAHVSTVSPFLLSCLCLHRVESRRMLVPLCKHARVDHAMQRPV